MGMLCVECDTDKVSDGCHTFGELYEHRQLLYIALMLSHPNMSWKSLIHNDLSYHKGWFIAGMRTPKGDISYHLSEKYWNLLDDIENKPKAPHWDGHTSRDVLHRIEDWIENGVLKCREKI